MKKILTCVFITGLFFVLSAEAQMSKRDLQKMYEEYLKQEGYLPSIDSDGDILFKASGDNYYILVDEKDQQFFQIYLALNLGNTPLQDALAAANYSNRRSKVAKVYITQDGKKAEIKVELLLNNPGDFKPVFSRALALMQNAERNFVSQLKD